MGAALDQRDADAEPGEELRELDGDGAAAEDDEGLGRRVSLSAVSLVRQPSRRAGAGASGATTEPVAMTKCAGGEASRRCCSSSVCGSAKAGGGAEEFEFAAGELLPAVIGEVSDQGVLAGHDLCEVEADVVGADAPRLGVAGEVHDFGGVEQGLGGHAAAQDAESADFFAAVDDGGFEPERAAVRAAAVAGAAAADDGDINACGVHGERMVDACGSGKREGGGLTRSREGAKPPSCGSGRQSAPDRRCRGKRSSPGAQSCPRGVSGVYQKATEVRGHEIQEVFEVVSANVRVNQFPALAIHDDRCTSGGRGGRFRSCIRWSTCNTSYVLTRFLVPWAPG